MKKPFALLFVLAGLASLIVSAFLSYSVSAHQSIQVGDYQVEIGWLDEPPVVGQRNALVVNISADASGPASSGQTNPKASAIDISAFKVDVVYGGESKTLTLQPLSEDSHDQYVAPILPTRAGKYTVKLSGTLGAAAANAEVQPEEVALADSLQFPRAADPSDASAGQNLASGLAVAALLVSLGALLVSAMIWLKNRR